MPQQHDLRLLAFSERVHLAVRAMGRDSNITRTRAASTFKVKRKSLRDQPVHNPAEAFITSTDLAPNDPENRNFHVLPVELICTILFNLESARDVVAVGQTNQILRRIAIDHLCRHACRYNAVLWATTASRRTLLHLLLEKGATFAHRESDFMFAVACAAGKGDEVMVKSLLDATIHKYGTTTLFGDATSEAVLRGHVHIVELVFDMCTTMGVDYTDLYSKALVGASYRGQEQIVRMLLNIGVSVKGMGYSTDRALYLAASNGHGEITKLLLEAGANVNATGYAGRDSALQMASWAGHDTIVGLLLDAGAGTSRHRGVFYGSALQKASESGHVRVVELLLKADAPVNTFGGRPGSALQRARRNRHWKVVELLRRAGARESAPV